MPDTDPEVTPPLIDGHNDTVLRCTDDDRRAELSSVDADADPGSVPGVDEAFLGEGGPAVATDEPTGGGHLDLPRALDAGLAAGFFATFVPNAADPEYDPESVDLWAGESPPAVDARIAQPVVYDQLAALHRWDRTSDAFRLVRDVDDLDACLDRAGEVVGAIPHVEGAAVVEPDLSNLDLLYAAGLRSIGLVWSRPNQFAHGVPFVHNATPDTGPGLTDAGRRLVEACDDRGIVVDCAHLNSRGFRDVLEVSTAPPVVSHACAHEVCPATRNLTNEQLRAIGERDGLVGLSFGTTFLHPDGDGDANVDLDLLVDHVDVFVEHAGVDAVALGSDFDGASIPDAIGDVGGVRDLLDAIRERGYSDDDVRKIAFENWRRVLAATWA